MRGSIYKCSIPGHNCTQFKGEQKHTNHTPDCRRLLWSCLFLNPRTASTHVLEHQPLALSITERNVPSIQRFASVGKVWNPGQQGLWPQVMSVSGDQSSWHAPVPLTEKGCTVIRPPWLLGLELNSLLLLCQLPNWLSYLLIWIHFSVQNIIVLNFSIMIFFTYLQGIFFVCWLDSWLSRVISDKWVM